MKLLKIETTNSIIIDDQFDIQLNNSSSMIIDYSFPMKTFSQTIIFYLVDMTFVETIEKLQIVDNISFIKYDSSKIIIKTIDNE